MSKRLQTDGIAVTDDEAVELVIHHLRLAGMFFQNVPSENETLLLVEELNRQCPHEDLNTPGYLGFINGIVGSYEEDGKRNP